MPTAIIYESIDDIFRDSGEVVSFRRSHRGLSISNVNLLEV